MPSQNKSSSALLIKIDNEPRYFQPGDTIRGQVEFVSNKDIAIGSVTLEVSGQVRSKVVQSNGQAESVFEDKLDLTSTNLKLYDGHYKHKSGTFYWPFECRIPKTFDSSEMSSAASSQAQTRRYDVDTVQQHPYPMPPSFHFESSAVGKAWSASISYELIAKVSHPRDATLPGSQKISTCTKSLYVQRRSGLDPIDLDDPSQRRGTLTSCIIRSWRLAPEQNKGTSFLAQKAQALFQPSSLPRFTFEVDISYPSMVQAYHAGALPFIVAVSPRTEAALTTIQPSLLTFYRYPSVLLKRFTLHLEVCTECRCIAIADDACASSSDDILLAKACFDDGLRLLMRSTACDQKVGREGDALTGVDLGRQCNVRITDAMQRCYDVKGKGGTTSKGLAQDQKAITPSIETPLVARRYWFRWEIEFECVEEKVVVKGKSPSQITILPSCPLQRRSSSDDFDWIAAPSEEPDLVHRSNCAIISSSNILPAYTVLPTNETTVAATPSRKSKAQ